jgi:hypothetical protein
VVISIGIEQVDAGVALPVLVFKMRIADAPLYNMGRSSILFGLVTAGSAKYETCCKAKCGDQTGFFKGYVRSAVKFLDTGAFEKPKKVILDPPDFTRLTSSVPGLKEELDRR